MTSSSDPFSPTYRHPPAPLRQPAQPRMNDAQRALRMRIVAVAQKALDVAEAVLDRAAAPPPDRVPVAVTRRQVANALGSWRVCANAACQRAGCCRGEALHCLRYGLPVMPNALAGLLKMRRARRRGRRLPARDETC